MRAAHIQANLTALDQMGLPLAQRVRARMDPQIVEQVEQCSRTTWLPVDLDIALTVAIGEVLGLATTRAWSRDALLHSMQSPILRPLVKGAFRVFGGGSPHSLLRMAPQAWALIYRNCGGLAYEKIDDGSCTVRSVKSPPVLWRERAYRESFAGAIEGALATCDTEGTIALEPWDPADHQLVVRIHWQHAPSTAA